ncbi:MAG: hypothetical protein HYV26_24905 [Candidatus Hydrogenedentes bacterium]|nr:hypothetical protein [Candidatus Hydrogenedentota bacterium]
MHYTKFEQLSIRSHPELSEQWVQDRIAEDPSILGLGDVILKDRERAQPRAGRLDLLLQDVDTDRRFEVEIQLGATDESHIIRSIEYWDIERKRYPQYEHTAVIVAEDITSRFLNVVSLFNGMIPLIAVQMKAFRVGDQVGLVFTTVLDQTTLGLVDEDEEKEPTNRAYWEQRGSSKTVSLADQLLEMAKVHNKSLELKYNKVYIGLAKDGQPCNFILFRPKKRFIQFEPRFKYTSETQERLESSGLDVMGYNSHRGRFRIRLQPGDIEKHREILAQVVAEAFAASEVE